LSSRGTALGQQENNIDIWTATPSDLTFAVTQVPPVATVTQVAPTDSALTSTEQGATTLDESFDFRQWQLEKRRQALKDTKFELNLRSFYFDRSDFNRSEKQAWAIGGWLGVKTGYFLDHVAFGATVYTSNPIMPLTTGMVRSSWRLGRMVIPSLASGTPNSGSSKIWALLSEQRATTRILSTATTPA
jgi:hypothetical protein